MLGDEDTIAKLKDKVDDYHRFGVRMVWVADPRARAVTLFPLGGTETIVREGERIGGGDILPGLYLPVTRLFEVD